VFTDYKIRSAMRLGFAWTNKTTEQQYYKEENLILNQDRQFRVKEMKYRGH